jgi:hypothetical protein
MAAAMLVACVSACGGSAPSPPTPSASSSSSSTPDLGTARVALAARAALAQDHRFAALYTLEAPDRGKRNVVATVADDGSWRVDIAGGVLGGTADVSIISNTAGVYQCSLSSATNPISPACVLVAQPSKRVPAEFDPGVERVFRQSLSVFTDRQAALSVTAVAPLPGSQAQGLTSTCFSVDSISASLSAPVDVGIYCYAPDGLLTAARTDFGLLALASAPVPPPAAAPLPGPVVNGPAMGLESPPPPPVVVVTPSTVQSPA